MKFIKYIECDFEFLTYNTLNRIYIHKFILLENTYFLPKVSIKLYIIFNKIRFISSLRLYRYLFFFWMLTGKLVKVSNYKILYEKGVKFYSFLLYINLTDFHFFRFIDFLINGYVPILKQKNFFLALSDLDKVCYVLSYFEHFSNFRLSHSMYSYSIDADVLIEFQRINKIKDKQITKLCNFVKLYKI